MQNLIGKLGKPKSWWITMGCAASALLVGLIVMVAYWLGVTAHIRASICLIGALWLIGVVSMLTYFVGQLSGRYANLQGRSWSDLPW